MAYRTVDIAAKTAISASILVLELDVSFTLSLRQYYLVQVPWVDDMFSRPLSRVTFPAPLNLWRTIVIYRYIYLSYAQSTGSREDVRAKFG